jgi:hypothetical protein
VESINLCSDNLLKIINDILDIAKIEAGRLEIYTSKFIFREFIENIKNSFAIPIHKKGLDFFLYVDKKIPSILEGDDGKLIQIITNIIGNAVKFTEKGSIRFDIREINRQNEFVELEFLIKDTGVGFSKDKEKQLFLPFEQGDLSYTKKFQGTGLGLTITKKLIEMMGGSISIHGEINVGTTVKINIRFRFDESLDEENKNEVSLEEIDGNYEDILLIDKDSHHHEILTEFLKGYNLKLNLVQDIELAMKEVVLEKYKFIFFDSSIIDQNIEIKLENIKKNKGIDAKCVILLNTIEYVEVKKSGEYGLFDGILQKPIVREDVLNLLKTIGTKTKMRLKENEEQTQKIIDIDSNDRILAVEDSEESQLVIQMIFKT